MSSYTAIDLSQIAPPDVVEPLDYEAVRTALLADFAARYPDYDAVLESDPAVKLLEVAAYREILLRARVNDAARAVLLATAAGTDLEHLAALFGVARLSGETDARLRTRAQLSLEGFSTAGPVGAYVFWALSADPTVRDVSVASPVPGEVLVTVLASAGDGTPDQALLDAVDAALNVEDVRPLTDRVTVLAPATIHDYTVEAELTFYAGPSSGTVLAAAQAAVEDYVAAHHRLGHDINRSGLLAALHQPGVHNVDLTAPAADLVVAHDEVAYCTGITLTDGGVGE